MTCYSPQHGYRGRDGQFVSAKKDSPSQAPMTVGCGKCVGCRNDRAQQWSTRIVHEASMYKQNCFVTLTYSDENLPDSYSVNITEIQKFMKRLRKHISMEYNRNLKLYQWGDTPKPKKPICRYFAVGEYGSKTLRPHYHLIIFGYDFPDKVLWRVTDRSHRCYRSDLLEKAWPFGQSEIGNVTEQSAGYVARYTLKKVSGALAKDHYTRIHPLTGESVKVEPEFVTMSTHPGIGASWFRKYEMDVFPSDFAIVNGKKKTVPRYYCNKLRERYGTSVPEKVQLIRKDDLYPIQQRRKKALKLDAPNRTPERLAVREESHLLKVAQLKREI